MKRLVVAITLALGISMTGITVAYADYETIVNDWFKTEGSCLSRGHALENDYSSGYYDPRCTKNFWNDRWTLHMMVRTSGGGGGGGGGGWFAPERDLAEAH